LHDVFKIMEQDNSFDPKHTWKQSVLELWQ